MCATCGCNYTNYNHEGMKVPMLPNGINPMPLANGKIPLPSGTVTAVPKKPKGK